MGFQNKIRVGEAGRNTQRTRVHVRVADDVDARTAIRPVILYNVELIINTLILISLGSLSQGVLGNRRHLLAQPAHGFAEHRGAQARHTSL